MSTVLNIPALENQYRFLDALPECLYEPAVTLMHGSLAERTSGILRWREALLQGRLPESGTEWPQPLLGNELLQRLSSLNIARFCRAQTELTDTLLLDICRTIEQSDLQQNVLFERHFAELKRLEEERLKQKALQAKAQNKAARRGIKLQDLQTHWEQQKEQVQTVSETVEQQDIILNDTTLETLREQARKLAEAESSQLSADGFYDNWLERARAWNELADVFDELGGLLGRGWDLSQGLLKSQGWLEIVRLRELLEKLPYLKDVVRHLGRIQFSEDDDTPPVMEEVFTFMMRVFEDMREVRTPLAPHETRGIKRSSDIMRMLPSESAYLGHPKLKMLWHARRAEEALLTYQVEGVLSEHIQAEREVLDTMQQPGKQQRQEKGQIIVCLDTSGSMHGTPELVAKALTLEALRTALREKRDCYVYAFSGPEQVIEHQLELTEQGLADFMAFLLRSFHGGTDISAPLQRAIDKLQQEKWKKADILLVSDGEFGVPGEMLTIVEQAKENDRLRIHGVLVGGWRSHAMEQICTKMYKFSDWREMV